MCAVVTGAASGIGRGLATVLADRGLNVVAVDLPGPALEGVAAVLGDTGARVLPVGADVRLRASMQDAARAAADAFGPVDLLCNNAGVVGPYRPVWEQRDEDWAWVHSVDLLGVVHGISAFVPAMVERGRGHVVNTASMEALCPIPIGGNAPYAAAKAGVLALSRTLRTDLRRAGAEVGVSVAAPGPVATAIRDSERRRPDELRVAGEPAPVLPPVDFGYERITADVAAARIVEGVEDDRFLVLPNRGSEADARAGLTQLLDEAEAELEITGTEGRESSCS